MPPVFQSTWDRKTSRSCESLFLRCHSLVFRENIKPNTSAATLVWRQTSLNYSLQHCLFFFYLPFFFLAFGWLWFFFKKWKSKSKWQPTIFPPLPQGQLGIMMMGGFFWACSLFPQLHPSVRAICSYRCCIQLLKSRLLKFANQRFK